jgi:hypothetical protein
MPRSSNRRASVGFGQRPFSHLQDDLLRRTASILISNCHWSLLVALPELDFDLDDYCQRFSEQAREAAQRAIAATATLDEKVK